jgi:outer membrane biogenesis lipoprotein LolB
MPKGSTAGAPAAATALYSGFLPASQREAEPETKSSKTALETKSSKAAPETKSSKDKARTAQSAAALSQSATGLRIPVVAFLSGLAVAMAASRVHAVRRRRLFRQEQERERSEELYYALMA